MCRARVPPWWPSSERITPGFVRDHAAKQGQSEEEALKKGMEEKAVEFKQAGAQIYHKS